MQYIVKNLTKKVILLSDIDGMPPLEPKEERDLAEFTHIENIEKSKILAQLIKQNYIEHYEEEIEEEEESVDDGEPSDEDMDDVLQNIKNLKKEPSEETNENIVDEAKVNDAPKSDKYDSQLFDENGKIIIDLIPEEITGTLDAIKEVCKSTNKKMKDISQKHETSYKEFSDIISDLKAKSTAIVKSDTSSLEEDKKAMKFHFKNMSISKLKDACQLIDTVKRNTDFQIKNVELRFELE